MASGHSCHQHSHQKHALGYQTRFWISLILFVPLLMLSMGELGFVYIQALLSASIVCFGGFPFFKNAWQSLKVKQLNMFTLIAMGTGVSLVYSLAVTFLPIHQILPQYFEAAAGIIVLVLLGQHLEEKAHQKTGRAIQALLSLTPDIAHRLTENQQIVTDIQLSEVRVDDVLQVKPGEKIPVDGVVLEGESMVDESMLTGEPIAVTKREKGQVIAGAINGAGVLVIRATKVGKDTLLQQIVHLVSEAEKSHAPIQRLVDKVSAYFVPTVIGVAILTGALWYFLLPHQQGLSQGIISAVSVLIIACPCALGLATPMSIMVGVGRGASLGILIKNAAVIETLEQVDTVFFDKTGTLTEGRPTLSALLTTTGFKKEELLALGYALEHHSEHPLAKAIVNSAKAKKIKRVPAKKISVLPGQGICGEIDGKHVALGQLALMQALEVPIKKRTLLAKANAYKQQGAGVIFIAVNHVLAGCFVVSDNLKPSSIQAIKQLSGMHKTPVMLTGDNKMTAKAIAKEVHIHRVYSELLPQDKHKVIQKYQKAHHMTAMVGDGINDAPALALANVGIAMGTGADIAMESAGITLLQGDLMQLPRAFLLSHAIMNNIKQNLFFAFFYNAAAIPVAAGVLYPWFGIQLSPMFAAAAMSLSSISVVFNALRLHRFSV